MLKVFHEPALDEVYVEGSNEEVFSGRLLKVQRDHVTLPNGSDTTREYIRHPGAVAIVPVLEDGRVVLVKQCRYPLGTLLWEIPAGKLDHGEAEGWQHLLSIATTPGFSDEIIHLYKAWGLKKYAQHTDEDEFIGVQAFTQAELKKMVATGELYDSKSLCALYAAGIL